MAIPWYFYGKGDNISPGYCAKLDSLYLVIKKLNQKGKPAGVL